MRAVSRFIQLFREHKLEASQISCNAGGLGIPMCDSLAGNGWKLRRVHNGSPAKDTPLTRIWAQKHG